jgi:hypothetical protein
MVGHSNNHRATDRSSSFESRNNARGGGTVSGGIQTLADLNKRNHEHFAAKR